MKEEYQELIRLLRDENRYDALDYVDEAADAIDQLCVDLKVMRGAAWGFKLNMELMKRERDAAVNDLARHMICDVCVHSVKYTGIPCAKRQDKPADGTCDFEWRGVKYQELPETCPQCGYIEEREPVEADAFCPNCRERMDGEATS